MTKTDFKDRLKKLGGRLEKLAAGPVWRAGCQKLARFEAQMAEAGFWQSSAAGQIAKRAGGLQQRRDQLEQLQTRRSDLLSGSPTKAEIDRLEADLDRLEADASPALPHADADVYLTIYAGAGGTDAQDWVGQLFRMYQRWADGSGCQFDVLSQSAGDEAGLKMVSAEIRGDGLYGQLVGEHGVHRLVRKSPFNSRGLRQTSFARVEISPQISLGDQPAIPAAELRWDFFRSRGPGGQSVNTTDSAVRVTHLPTKTTVTIQNERSQHQNRQTALAVLESKLAARRQAEAESQLEDLKGPLAANEWSSQIRNYVFDPYQLVKDLRTGHQVTGDKEVVAVLDGQLEPFLAAYSSWRAQAGAGTELG